jgi:hypothetical protein
MTDSARGIRVVVDRREGSTLVLIDDNDKTYDVPADKLPKNARREGAVLDVPVDESGTPQWSRAKRNAGEEEARMREVQDRLAKLRRSDPGGDVSL